MIAGDGGHKAVTNPPVASTEAPGVAKAQPPPSPPPGTTKYSTIFSISLETRWHPRTHQLGGEWGGVREGWGVGGVNFPERVPIFCRTSIDKNPNPPDLCSCL